MTDRQPIERLKAQQPPKTNGNGETSEELAVRQGIERYREIVAKCMEVEERLHIAEKLIAINKIEIAGLTAQLEAERSRVASYQTERDDAVAVSAALQAVIKGVIATCREFDVATTPDQQDAE